MAEEQFTSRRARREAERLAADQAFEARESPEQPGEPSSNNRGDLLNPPPAPAPEPEPRATAPEPEPSSGEDPLDPQQAPLPHFDSRTARKNYLREHGLSQNGDVSTGAIPVIAGPDETSPEESGEGTTAEDESFDTAGFGGSADEVAARDFESPVTADSAPRPTALDGGAHDALSQPFEDLDAAASATDPPSAPAPTAREDDAPSPRQDDAPSSAPEPSARSAAEPKGPESSAIDDDGSDDDFNDASGATARSRRMPIVQPPSSSGVRVVTAASAQIPEVDSAETTTDAAAEESRSRGPDSSAGRDEKTATTGESTHSDAPVDEADSASGTGAAEGTGGEGAGSTSDDAARALAANPETRPMETVPEAWALPNPDYEDEETENPPGTRIRASEVTGHDGRILVGEEPSKVPYVVLGVAALFAVALIVIALVMLL